MSGVTEELKGFARDAGAEMVGVAPLGPFRGNIETVPAGLLEPFGFAVSMAVAVDREVIESIADGPTPRYADAYRQVNESLAGLSRALCKWIEARGGRALAIPPSEKLSGDRLLGSLSHKAVARMAGLGWQGKSLLIVTPDFGPRVRLVSVLTDMRLEADSPMENGCGDCTSCADACPASAIKGEAPAGQRYMSRDEAIHLELCYRKTLEHQADPSIGATICGVCIRACPFSE